MKILLNLFINKSFKSFYAKRKFSKTLLVNQTADVVFDAIMNVRGWWSGLYGEIFEGNTNQPEGEFTFLAGNGAHYSKQKLIEFIPGKKAVWLITDSKLSFLKDESEWTGTKISFEISTQYDKTIIVFTHIGLVPKFECYNNCSAAWTAYLDQRLLTLITGKILPDRAKFK